MIDQTVNPLDFEGQLSQVAHIFPTHKILDMKGEIINRAAYDDLALADDELRLLMRRMVWTRELNHRSTILAKQGWMSFHAPYAGQEASQIGSHYAFDKKDFMLAGYREYPPLVLQGLPLSQCFHWNNGHVKGNDFSNFYGVPVQVIIGAQIVQGAGVGLGMKMRGSEQVAYTYTGDGGTSQGDFYEGLNFAGRFASRIVYIVENNEYAISTHWKQQTAAGTLAQKAVAAGIPGIQVDGMDVLAVLSASRAARDWTAAGKGPVLIETLCSRYDPHSLSGDNPSIYRTEESFEFWNERDALTRMRNFLSAKGIWTQEDDDKALDEARADVRQAVREVNETPKQKVSDFILNMFEKPTAELKEQLKTVYAREEKMQ